MASMADTMPEIVLVAETDAAAARRVRRLAVAIVQVERDAH